MIRLRKAHLSVLFCLLCGTTFASAQVKFTAIDVPGAAATVAYSINTAGDVVGAYQAPSSSAWHAFKLSAGKFTSFDYPGATNTLATGINDNDLIVGHYDFGQVNTAYGFQYDGSAFTSFQYQSRAITETRGVNNAGQLVGESGNSQKQVGFKLIEGTFAPIRPPGENTYYYVIVNGINDVGQIAGFVVHNTGTNEGFVYKKGLYAFLDYPGAQSTAVYGVNDRGVMVGNYLAGADLYGFATKNGKFVSLIYPGAVYTFCYAINSEGMIVGSAVVGSVTHGFVTSSIGAEQFSDK